MESKPMNVGDVFIFGRMQYIVVAKFTDLGREYIVAKNVKKDGRFSYSNIFAYTDYGRLFKHI